MRQPTHPLTFKHMADPLPLRTKIYQMLSDGDIDGIKPYAPRIDLFGVKVRVHANSCLLLASVLADWSTQTPTDQHCTTYQNVLELICPHNAWLVERSQDDLIRYDLYSEEMIDMFYELFNSNFIPGVTNNFQKVLHHSTLYSLWCSLNCGVH